MQVADPDGYFKSGSRAAEVAKVRAQKSMQLEKQQKDAQERRRKEKLVSGVFDPQPYPRCPCPCPALALALPLPCCFLTKDGSKKAKLRQL